jgi:hypothetical protein
MTRDRWGLLVSSPRWLVRALMAPVAVTDDLARAERSRLLWGLRERRGAPVAVLTPLGLLNSWRPWLYVELELNG